MKYRVRTFYTLPEKQDGSAEEYTGFSTLVVEAEGPERAKELAEVQMEEKYPNATEVWTEGEPEVVE